MASKLFVLVWAGLEPGARISQAIHGVDEFRDAHPEIHKAWRVESNTLAVLSFRDEEQFQFLKARAEGRDIPHAVFREPDLGDKATCLILAPGPASRNLVSKLALAA